MSEEQSPSPAQIYESFLVPGIHARWTPLFLEHARPERGERVLDVACGTGIVSRNVAPLVGEEGTVTALDVSPEMLAVARDLAPREGPAVEWCEGDACSLPFADEEFDLALCQQGLQFMDNRAAAVREMRRVLDTGGRVTLSVWQDLARHPLYEAICTKEADYLNKPVSTLSTPFTMGNADDLHGLLGGAGFQRVEIAQVSHAARFPSPERFVTLTLLAAASIIPESEMDEDARAEMVGTIKKQVDGILQDYVDGDSVSFSMHAHIAIAYA